MAAFCARHAYRGRRSPEALLERMRNAAGGNTGPVLTRAMRETVHAHVAVLAALNTAIKSLDRSVAAHLADHPDGKVFASFPRSGTINAAQILAEWGDSRDAYDGLDAVAALGGLVPVTRSSGKYRGVNFRWACNKRLRFAVTTFADNSRHVASGPQISAAAPVPAARITSTQSGFLLEPGCGLSGAAGAPARPTTVRFTTARRNTSPAAEAA